MSRLLVGILITVGAFALLLGGIDVYRRLRRPDPEVVRKLLHVGMGLVVLSFPWLFDTPWPIVALSALFVLLFLLRRSGKVGGGGPLAAVLDGVGRRSLGDVYFALSVGILFYFARGDKVLYLVPMLLLTIPDAVAALIGVGYGRQKYFTTAGEKSAEGSIAFFATAFLSAHVPVLLMTGVGRAETLVIALTLALLVMILEGIAWRGLDNLFVPLGAFLLLDSFLAMPLPQLLACLAAAAACLVFALLWRTRGALDGGAALGAALVLYLVWALGGWRWLVAPMTNLVGFTVLWPRTAREAQRGHGTHAVAGVAAAGLAWLFLHQALGHGWAAERSAGFFFPYTLAFAVHLAIIGAVRLRRMRPGLPTAPLLATTVAQGWLLLFVPYVLIEGVAPRTLMLAGLALPVVAAATTAFYATQPGIQDCPSDPPRWLRQGGYAAIASLGGLVSLLL